jgi:cobalamin biosynthesis Mg chelatase CobN
MEKSHYLTVIEVCFFNFNYMLNMLPNEPKLKPLQVSNPSFLKALNQSSQVGPLALQQHPWSQAEPQAEPQESQAEPQESQAESQESQAEPQESQAESQESQAEPQAPLSQAEPQAPLSQAEPQAPLSQLLPALHEAKPAEAVNDTTNKTASKIPIVFFILSIVRIFIYLPLLFFVYVNTIIKFIFELLFVGRNIL